ncbi:MAG: hypothetical protein FWG22_06855, partial [Prolixibacteraceae bacterium]|nr:hypothetical protein [Prolixibacteraceae bacterium]
MNVEPETPNTSKRVTLKRRHAKVLRKVAEAGLGDAGVKPRQHARPAALRRGGGFGALRRKPSRHRTKSFNPARTMVLGFLVIIFAGACLLKLPIASRDGGSVPFLTALFTSTSATCVTGLIVVDTATTWSFFGRAVILCLFQIGGLGFITITTIFFFLMDRKISLTQRLLMVQSLNLHDRQGIVGQVRSVLLGTFIFEGFGALILWARFAPDYGVWGGLGMGVFHSVSAFCNAGFALMGDFRRFSSLAAYSGDVVVMITIMLLVFIGGLGFFVWEDVRRRRRFSRLHLHSKLVLTISLSLIVVGWVFFYFTERSNPATLGGMPFSQAAVASLFQSVMPRSGGFSVFDQAAQKGVSKLVSMALMFVGGSAGSTAGGIKNVTAGILVLSALRSMMGKRRLTVFKRTIPETQVVSAFSIVCMALSAWFIGTVAVALIQPELPVIGVMFEMASAIATCGLSHGIVPLLAPVPMVIAMLLIFFGRIGIMTVGMAAFFKHGQVETTKRPETW